MLFAEGRNAVQVQRWPGHHSPAFTLSVYVHLLDGDIGEPLVALTAANIDSPGPHQSTAVMGQAGSEPRSLRRVAA
jgi:hypothetical protein